MRRPWPLGLSLLGHVLVVVLGGVAVIAGIFFVDGLPGLLLIVAGIVLGLLSLIFMEWRRYQERSGPAFPGDRGYRGR